MLDASPAISSLPEEGLWTRTPRSRAAGRPALGGLPDLGTEVSVIVPTYQEGKTLPGTLRAIDRVLSALPYPCEIIVVDDDSPDGTARAAQETATATPLRVVVRHGERGLASAILHGLSKASGRVGVVLDADGSHPPELIPSLVAPVLGGGAEMVVGSRYIEGSVVTGWPLRRRVLSRAAYFLARPLTDVRDAMSGYFAVDPRILRRAPLDPIGYKVGLEILVRCEPAPVVEVPMHFTNRRGGASKMGAAEIGRYVLHLRRLYGWRFVGRRRFRAEALGAATTGDL